jgi:hypothetical protein
MSHLEQVDDREQAVAILLELRPLVTVIGVLDGQRMQVEFQSHLVEFVRCCIAQGNPDEAIGIVEVVTDFVNIDIGKLLAFAVGNAVDQH